MGNADSKTEGNDAIALPGPAGTPSRSPDALAEGLRRAYGGEVPLDALGEVLGLCAAGTDEVEALLAGLERAGARVIDPMHRSGPELLALVVPAARTLRAKLGRAATRRELVDYTKLTETEVTHALEFSKVLGR